MGRKTLSLISRASPLAVAQVHETLTHLQPHLPDSWETTHRTLDTPGDRDRTTALTDDSIPDDFFTRDLDEALLTQEADLAVHSAKDLPDDLHPGLHIAAMLPARDIRDAMVTRRDLPADASLHVIGTSSPRRQDFVKRHLPHATLRAIRGNISERIEQVDQGNYDAVIIAACALDRLGLSDRIHSYLDWEPAPLQGRLALVVRSDDTELIRILRSLDVRHQAGLVAMVGCPADPMLLSEKASRYLDEADLVFHDRLLPDEILLRIQDRAVPVGKAGGKPSISQHDIHRQMLHAVESGKLVVRLQGGDPGIFGHLGEELTFFQDWEVRTDIVPAVTAAQLAATRAGVPLTHRDAGRSITLVSAHHAEDKAPITMPPPGQGNVCVYMPVKNRHTVQERLLAAGWPAATPVLVAERLGYKDETVHMLELSDLANSSMQGPAVLLVGSGPKPPACTTLFVGTNPDHFLKHGPLLHWPLIKLVARPLRERQEILEKELSRFDGILFPSRFSVPSFMEALLQFGDTRLLAGKKILAVGPATADELLQSGLRVDLACASYRGVRELAGQIGQGHHGRYLYPCSDASPQEARIAAMAAVGITLVPAVFYRNREMPFKELPCHSFQRVLFTSASTVQAYFRNYPQEKNAKRSWIAVGPSTLEAIEAEGLTGESL